MKKNTFKDYSKELTKIAVKEDLKIKIYLLKNDVRDNDLDIISNRSLGIKKLLSNPLVNKYNESYTDSLFSVIVKNGKKIYLIKNLEQMRKDIVYMEEEIKNKRLGFWIPMLKYEREMLEKIEEIYDSLKKEILNNKEKIKKKV